MPNCAQNAVYYYTWFPPTLKGIFRVFLDFRYFSFWTNPNSTLFVNLAGWAIFLPPPLWAWKTHPIRMEEAVAVKWVMPCYKQNSSQNSFSTSRKSQDSPQQFFAKAVCIFTLKRHKATPALHFVLHCFDLCDILDVFHDIYLHFHNIEK